MSSPLRVLVVGWEPPPVNGMTVATQLLATMTDPDLQVELVLVPSRSRLQGMGRVGTENLVRFVRFVARFLAKRPWRYDLVHLPIAQTPIAILRDLIIGGICVVSRTPFAIHLHGGEYRSTVQNLSPALQGAVRRVMGHAAGAIVLSPVLRDELGWIRADLPLFICRNGVLEASGAATKRVAGTNSLRVGYIGAISRKKGIDVLLAATQDMPRVELVLAGELYEDVACLVHRHPNASHVGWVEGVEKSAFFAGIDVIVLASRFQEGQPMALIEAMSSGVPVVVTDRPHLREMLGDAAFFIPENGAEELREALEELRSFENRKDRGERLQARFREAYTAAAAQGAMASTWRQIVHRQGSLGASDA